MKKLLLLVLAAPLAGCTQRADLANSVGQPAPGPFTLRYKLADQNSHQYQLRIEGDTTSGLSSQSSSEPAAGLTPKTPDRTVQAKFNTQMTIQQDTSAALDAVSENTTGSASGIAAPDAATGDTSGRTSMNEDRTPGNERTGDVTMPADAASEGTPGSIGTPDTAAVADRFELRQQVKNWTAQVELPQGQLPNRLNGSFQDGQMAIEAQGAQIDLPQRYQQQIQQTLNRPVIATVTSKGEILNVEWPVPEQAASTAPGVETETSPDGLRAMTGSTESLNLWFGVIRLPDAAVNVGQTWDAKDQFPVRAGTNGPQFHMEREAKYTLTNVTQTSDGPVAEIAVNETLKLIRGELSGSETTSATTSTDSTGTNDSAATSSGTTTATADADAKPDLLQTRMGKVYFNIDRGMIDRSEQQVSVTWNTTLSEAASSTGTASTQVATQGQLQGTIHLDRITNTAATTGTSGAPATTLPSDISGSSPPATTPSPSGITPGTSAPRAGTRTTTP